MKKKLVLLSTVLALAAALGAQEKLTPTSSLPVLDGTISANEYQYQGSKSGMKVAATLGSDDILYLAVEAPSTGWAGIGVGGLVMNGSRLFMASVTDGKPSFIEKAGVGHFYADAKNLVVKKWAVNTANGSTTLELSIPSSAAVWKGQVNEIFAYSKSASLTSRHGPKGSITYSVK